MRIYCRGEFVDTRCTGCQCHEMAMQFGDLIDGCCCECGCPKTLDAWTATRAAQKAAADAKDVGDV